MITVNKESIGTMISSEDPKAVRRVWNLQIRLEIRVVRGH